ncbi:MAG: carboxypeptidase-like regulatory domain-containing protein, partial [Pedobacter sp.]|uniref:carboxypeptidase-like regulatory domain-containing protein n=1 Tax=Pedobacter sp. TaxID=1411316 RepID=UPI0033997C64
MKVLYPTRIAFIILLFLFQFNAVHAQESQLIEVSGIVNDQDSKTPLAGVSVTIKGTIAGTTTDQAGKFKLRSKLKFPFKLVFTSVGFQTQEFDVKEAGSQLNIELVTQTIIGNEVVITASRVPESILK